MPDATRKAERAMLCCGAPAALDTLTMFIGYN
jgi:hypothetical protein